MRIIFIALCIHVVLSKPTQSPRTSEQTGDKEIKNRVKYLIFLGPTLLSYEANLDRPSYTYSVNSAEEHKDQSGAIQTDPATGEEYLSVQGKYSYRDTDNYFSDNRVTYTADKNGYRAKFIFGKEVTPEGPPPQYIPPVSTSTAKSIDPTLVDCLLGGGICK